MKKISLIIFLILITQLTLLAQIEWQENGVPVVQPDVTLTPEEPIITTDNFIVTYWCHFDNGMKSIYSQKFDSFGNKMWDDEGVTIHSSNLIHDEIELVASDNGSVIFSWLETFESDVCIVKTQKISSNGQLLWGQGIEIPNSYAYHRNLRTVETNDGGAFISWIGYSQESNLLSRINNNGQLSDGWDENHLQYNFAFNFEMCSDRENGIIIFDRTSSGSVIASRIDGSGNYVWDEIAISLFYNNEFAWDLDILAGNNNEFIAIKRDSNIHLTKFNVDGEFIWSSSLEYDDLSYNSKSSSVLSENDDLNVIVQSFSDNSTLTVHRLNGDGETLWNNVISEEPMISLQTKDFAISNSSSNGVVLCWQNNDEDKNIYLQNISDSGNATFPDQGLIISNQLYENRLINLTKIGNNYSINITSNINGFYQQFNKFYNENGDLLNIDSESLFGTYNFSFEVPYYRHHIVDGKSALVFKSSNNQYYAGYSNSFYQFINEDGTLHFGNSGHPLNQSNSTNLINSISDNNDKFATLWLEYDDSYNPMIKINEFNSEGDSNWNSDFGIELFQPEITESCTIDNSLISSYIFNGITNYIVIVDYHDDEFQYYRKAQRVSSEGTHWDDGIDLDNEWNMNIVKIHENIFAWSDNDDIGSIRISKFDEFGNFDENWPCDLVIEGDAGPAPIPIEINRVGENILLTWGSWNGDSIKGQLIDSSGTILWEDGGHNLLIGDDLMHPQTLMMNDCFYISYYLGWGDTKDLVIDKFDYSGNSIWTTEVTVIEDHSPYSTYPNIGEINDRIILCWKSADSYQDNGEIKVQVVSSYGDILLEPNGLSIIDPDWRIVDPIVKVANNNAYISWYDGRKVVFTDGVWSCDYGIYMQKLNFDYLFSPEEEVEPVQAQLSNYPNPFNPTTTISFQLNTESTEDTELGIFNIKGQKIKSYLIPPSTLSPITTVTWNGTDNQNNPVTSGVYLISLKSGDRNLSQKKCLLLK